MRLGEIDVSVQCVCSLYTQKTAGRSMTDWPQKIGLAGPQLADVTLDTARGNFSVDGDVWLLQLLCCILLLLTARYCGNGSLAIVVVAVTVVAVTVVAEMHGVEAAQSVYIDVAPSLPPVLHNYTSDICGAGSVESNYVCDSSGARLTPC